MNKINPDEFSGALLDPRYRFYFGVTDHLIKALPDSASGDLPFEMVASTPHSDLEGETVCQGPDAFDLRYFLPGDHNRVGGIRLGHAPRGEQVTPPQFNLGYPVEARAGYDELYVKGFFYRSGFGSQYGVPLWQGMRDNPGKHGYQPSVEGYPLRDPMNPRRIVKSLITRIAISDTVMNPKTWLEAGHELRKAIMAQDTLEDGQEGTEAYQPQNRESGARNRRRKRQRGRATACCGASCGALQKAISRTEAGPGLVTAAYHHLIHDHNQTPEEAIDTLSALIRAQGRR